MSELNGEYKARFDEICRPLNRISDFMFSHVGCTPHLEACVYIVHRVESLCTELAAAQSELERVRAENELVIHAGWNLAQRVQELERDGFLKAAVYATVCAEATTFKHHYKALQEPTNDHLP